VKPGSAGYHSQGYPHNPLEDMLPRAALNVSVSNDFGGGWGEGSGGFSQAGSGGKRGGAVLDQSYPVRTVMAGGKGSRGGRVDRSFIARSFHKGKRKNGGGAS